jgi:alpha-galactosidase/6-phospho-beta-glucosidase family protein
MPFLHNVEVDAIAPFKRSCGISPVNSGEVPAPLLGWLQTVVDEQELAVQAALTGDRDLVVQAMTVSPMLADKDRAAELAGRLLDANRDWLPQFFKKRR